MRFWSSIFSAGSERLNVAMMLVISTASWLHLKIRYKYFYNSIHNNRHLRILSQKSLIRHINVKLNVEVTNQRPTGFFILLCVDLEPLYVELHPLCVDLATHIKAKGYSLNNNHRDPRTLHRVSIPIASLAFT